MKKNIFITFPFNFHGKSDYIINNYLEGNSFQSYLYLTSHISKVKDFKLKLLKHKKFCIPPYASTIKLFAKKIIEENSSKRVISNLEKYLKIIEILEKGSFKWKEGNVFGMAQAISNFIKEIKISSENLDFAFLKDRVEKFEWSFRENLNYILSAIDVFEKYHKFLKENNLLDSEDIYTEAEKYIDTIEYKKLIIEGIYEITPHQKNFFKKLIQKIPEIIFSFYFDKKVPLDAKELILDKTINFLKNIENWDSINIEQKEVIIGEECYHFSSIEEEIKGIIELIYGFLKKDSSLNFEDFMLVFPSMPKYRPVVKRMFFRYNLPCEIIPGYVLSEESSINNLMKVIEFSDTYSWETLMSIISSRFFKKFDFKETERFSEYSREKFESIGFFKYDFEFEKTWKNINLLRKIIKFLDGKNFTISDWSEKIREIIEILDWDPYDNEIKIIFEQFLRSFKGDLRFSKTEILNILYKSMELVEIEKGRGVGITVSGVLETSGIEKKICFLGGMTEENIPNTPKSIEIFLPERLKKELNFADYNLKLARERLDIYRLKNENEKIIYTFPSKIQEKEQMKSIFLFNISEKSFKEKIFISKPKVIFDLKFSYEKFKKKFLENGKFKISVTELESFLKCPYKFYLEKVENIKFYKKPAVEEVPLLWGKVIHKSMEYIFSQYKNEILEESKIDSLKKSFIEKTFYFLENPNLIKEDKISELYFKILQERISEICKKFVAVLTNHIGHKILSIEEEIVVPTEYLIIKGKIDRIEITPTGEIEIIDIKTGTVSFPSYTEDNFFEKHNIQLPLYIWMMQKKEKKSKIKGIIWNFSFIEEGDIEKRYPKVFPYLDKIENFLIGTGKNIKEGKISFIPGKDTECFICSIKKYCHYGKN